MREFESLIAPFRCNDLQPHEGLITETELIAQKEKTNRQLRCRELLLQHSAGANLVVMYVFNICIVINE
jgi:hypothetical protein